MRACTHAHFDGCLFNHWWQMAELKQMGVSRQSHYKLLINPSHPLVKSLNKVAFSSLSCCALVLQASVLCLGSVAVCLCGCALR